jgi:hypothetical protein
VQNVRVPPVSRAALSLAVLTTAGALALSGCSSDTAGGETGSAGPASSSAAASASASSAAASPSPSTTVAVPDGAELTDQGSKLSYRDPATVIYESAQGPGTVLQLTVKSVRKGSLADFKGFILDDAYKQKASYYYANVTVKNVGEGDLGGIGVPLWGVNAANTLLPPVNFTTSFKPCPSKPLPAKFATGASLSTCLVFLSPDRGTLEAVSYRPSQEFNPITWTGDLTTPKPTPKATPKSKKKNKKS